MISKAPAVPNRYDIAGAGNAPHVTFELKRAVDLKGLLCVDLHQHASPSPDSAVSLRDRAASNLAEGLEVMVATDHNYFADWKPALAALGSAKLISTGQPMAAAVSPAPAAVDSATKSGHQADVRRRC